LASFQVALKPHIRVLSGGLSTRVQFRNWSTRVQFRMPVRKSRGQPTMPPSAWKRPTLMTLHHKIKNEHGTIANNMRRIPEPHLWCFGPWRHTERNLAVLGGDPDSMYMYNILHETIALLTFFEQAAAAYALTVNVVHQYTILKKKITEILCWRTGSLGSVETLLGSRHAPFLNIVHRIHRYHNTASSRKSTWSSHDQNASEMRSRRAWATPHPGIYTFGTTL